jgi:hypothetical protein
MEKVNVIVKGKVKLRLAKSLSDSEAIHGV